MIAGHGTGMNDALSMRIIEAAISARARFYLGRIIRGVHTPLTKINKNQQHT